jgi:hypothetical protein
MNDNQTPDDTQTLAQAPGKRVRVTLYVVGWLVLAVTQGVLTCITKMLENLSGGRPLLGVLYLVPLWLFASGIYELINVLIRS